MAKQDLSELGFRLERNGSAEERPLTPKAAQGAQPDKRKSGFVAGIR